MRVVMLDTCILTDWRVLRAGETHELPDDLAVSLMRSGVARAETIAPVETTAAPPAEMAVARPPRRRRGA